MRADGGASVAAQQCSAASRRRSTRTDSSGNRRTFGYAPAYLQSTTSVRAKQSGRHKSRHEAKRWTVG